MGSAETQSLHIFFFPFMAHGHILPTIDMAKLFASRGLATTVVTTPLNAPNFTSAIQRTQKLGTKINVKTLNFPSLDQSGLPEGCESLDSVKSQETLISFIRATRLLQQPLEQLLSEECPDCLVADMFFPWATDVARKFGIPRLVFHGTSFFSLCTAEIIRLHEPHNKVASDSDPFLIPLLPDKIELTRTQLPDYFRGEAENELLKILHEAKESETRSYGVVVNSFYELEPAYARLFRDVLKRRAWAIGPVSLCNRDIEEKAQRGTKKPIIDGHMCLTWLDSKELGSVVYVCFGSVARLSKPQLQEIGLALEASGQHFIWVVRGDELEQSIMDRFENRGKGLIIRDWAPQVLILDHKAVGAFVTHCGWNSTLEGISAGVPMVTWPVSAEQFYNEKLVTHVLRIGVAVGAKQWVGFFGDKDVGATVVERNAIERAVKEVMAGEEAKSLRERAKAFAGMARKAVEEGGSSYSHLNALIEELKALKLKTLDRVVGTNI